MGRGLSYISKRGSKSTSHHRNKAIEEPFMDYYIRGAAKSCEKINAWSVICLIIIIKPLKTSLKPGNAKCSCAVYLYIIVSWGSMILLTRTCDLGVVFTVIGLIISMKREASRSRRVQRTFICQAILIHTLYQMWYSLQWVPQRVNLLQYPKWFMNCYWVTCYI